MQYSSYCLLFCVDYGLKVVKNYCNFENFNLIELFLVCVFFINKRHKFKYLLLHTKIQHFNNWFLCVCVLNKNKQQKQKL